MVPTSIVNKYIIPLQFMNAHRNSRSAGCGSRVLLYWGSVIGGRLQRRGKSDLLLELISGLWPLQSGPASDEQSWGLGVPFRSVEASSRLDGYIQRQSLSLQWSPMVDRQGCQVVPPMVFLPEISCFTLVTVIKTDIFISSCTENFISHVHRCHRSTATPGNPGDRTGATSDATNGFLGVVLVLVVTSLN